MSEPLAFAAALAREAGAKLAERYATHDWQARLKHDRSLVTSADLDADRLITSTILTHYPHDALLTEEQVDVPGFLTHPDRPTWIIDPLDGTTNFSLGLPHWGVLIARLEAGRPQIAAAYFPLLDELYTAHAGYGAWLNDNRLLIAPTNARPPLSFFACCSRTHRRYRVGVPYKTRILGSAAYTLCAVARGIAIVGFEASAHIWDIAAPWLVLAEAGGAVLALDSEPPFPLSEDHDYRRREFAVLAAADYAALERTRAQIQPV